MKNLPVFYCCFSLALLSIRPLAAQTVDRIAGKDFVREDEASLLDCANLISAGTMCCDQTVCAGDSTLEITESVAPSGGSGTLEYLWTKFNIVPNAPPYWTIIPNATGATFPAFLPTDTTYLMREARRAGCTPFLSCNIIKIYLLPADHPDCVVAASDVRAGTFTISPNPFYETSVLRNGMQAPVAVSIRDMNGAMMAAFQMGGGAEKQIGCAEWPSGIYFVEGKTMGGRMYVKKMVKL